LILLRNPYRCEDRPQARGGGGQRRGRARESDRFEWSTHRHACARREKCVGKDQRHRTLVVGEHHELLPARRREQQTEAFAAEKNKRNAVEGTQSEMGRGHGARQARYRGLGKMRLQNYFVGAACNATRWIRRMQWEMCPKRSALDSGIGVRSAESESGSGLNIQDSWGLASGRRRLNY
jgi:hypothetical protein